jgi:hypothetical protein
MSFCASSGSFQKLGSSALTFSSARRRVAVSTSKMPPQQSHGLLDLFFERKRLGAHGRSFGLAGATLPEKSRGKYSAGGRV